MHFGVRQHGKVFIDKKALVDAKKSPQIIQSLKLCLGLKHFIRHGKAFIVSILYLPFDYLRKFGKIDHYLPYLCIVFYKLDIGSFAGLIKHKLRHIQLAKITVHVLFIICHKLISLLSFFQKVPLHLAFFRSPSHPPGMLVRVMRKL